MPTNAIDARARRFRDSAEFDGLRADLGCVVSTFGLDWLSTEGGHVLQRLWKRAEPLATLEIATLGHSISRLSSHPEWLERKIEKVKSNDPGNARGAMFELLALAQFSYSPGVLSPTPSFQPGYDAIFEARGGGIAYVSIKHFGISPMYADFLVQAEAVRQALRERLRVGLRLNIEAPTFPGTARWDALSRFLREIQGPPPSPESLRSLAGFWVLQGYPLARDFENLAPRLPSHVLMITSPFATNEEANLRSRLEKACENLSKHAPLPGPMTANLVYLHLPDTIPMDAAVTWAHDWLKSHLEEAVTDVVLYQPSVVRVSEGASELFHTLRHVRRPNRLAMFPGNPRTEIGLGFPFGPCEKNSVSRYLQAGDGTRRPLGLRCAYQRGDVYIMSPGGVSPSDSGIIGSPASGVHLHCVTGIENDGAETVAQVFSASLPPSEDLLIL